jgi:hypothetical protein
MSHPQRLIAVGCLLLLMPLFGCGGKAATVTYYSLQAATPQYDRRSEQPAAVSVGVGPVRLPQLLKRPQLVTRDDAYRVVHAEADRWSGDLQEEIVYLLADNLARQLGSEQIVIFPWPSRLAPDWQLRVDIQRLDGVLGQAAYLEARWVLSNRREDLLLSGFKRSREALEQPGYQALVAAQGRLLERFGREMAERIRLRTTAPPPP